MPFAGRLATPVGQRSVAASPRCGASGFGVALGRRIGQLLRVCQRKPMNRFAALALAAAAVSVTSAVPPADYSVLIRGGTIYDGSGGAPYVGDVALKGDRIVYV